MSHDLRIGRRLRSANRGYSKLFQLYARMENRRVRRKARLVLSDVLRCDTDADERLERHRRHTAGWDAY
jgi:hypothetical protein